MRKLAFSILSVALAACSGTGEPPATNSAASVPESPEHVAVTLTPEQEQGRVIFEAVCWTCHGTGGHGDGPARTDAIVPPTFQTQDYALATRSTLQQRFQAGLEGDDPAHPHMQYVAKLVRPESFAAALAYVPVLAYPREIPGSAINGQRIYQFRCAGCHGKTGRGDGPGAENLIDMRPVDFTTDTLVASAKWDAVHAKIRDGGDRVHGSIMPSWSVVLNDADTWDLVAYLATFQPNLVAPPNW